VKINETGIIRKLAAKAGESEMKAMQ